ncbi:hypothetical protein P3X46_006394 [Hevea brasiliensis]|uniref:RING-type E3 ubiquitin transferase n=1 Tax=Hevea brasiliensis TaxID=3981 RepID=A0ABQ9MTW9_HEVBR|nr:uncharacterized protein LOC110638411 [Hevea brasiliensis]KAJ9182393.1 hypothetical protein P3X46_006394 [Hevea brasiliensis]
MASSTDCGYGYHINVSAWEIGDPVQDNTLSSSYLFITCKVELSYQSEAISTIITHKLKSIVSAPTKSIPKKITAHETEHTFRFPCDSFISTHGGKTVSSIISDMNIPFSLENIQWREHVCEPWVLLENPDDLPNHILDLARYTIKGFEKTGRKEFKMYIHIEKKIILSQQEYETMAQGIEDQERVEMIKATAMKEIIGYQVATGRLLSRTELLLRLRIILREKNATLDWSSLESLANQVSQTFMWTQKRGRSSLESSVEKAIEYLRVKGSDVESMGRCSICIQEVELKSYVSRLPCSHMFHRDCIKEWLNKSHLCPLCRFSLDQ